MNNTRIYERKALSVKAQIIWTLCALAAAVILPQICHTAGAALGVGSALGEILLPMHLPILAVGLFAGPFAGTAAGALAPLASFALTGMPKAGVLPFMMIELAVYGLVCGLLRDKKLPTLAKVILAQVAGRAVRAAAILVPVYVFGREGIAVFTIWTGITAGIWGLALQWLLLPLAVYGVDRFGKNDR